MSESDFSARLDRLESTDAIRQLPVRYALALDGRDLDKWVNLFVDDVINSNGTQGRAALKTHIEPLLRRFYRSLHMVMGQTIEFSDSDHASGYVYCRAEHEDVDKWIVMAIVYEDQYERREGTWYFQNRRERHWYMADLQDNPAAVNFAGWSAFKSAPSLPDNFPEWKAFWERAGADAVAQVTKLPVK